jgi:uncharacterized phage protein gp47/JayE
MPAPFSLTDLLAPPSPDQIRAKFLAFLGADPNPGLGPNYAHGFPVADWIGNPNGMEMAFANLVRSGIYDHIAVKQAGQISSGWLAKAKTLWLTYHAFKFYGIARNPATKTTFNLQLTSTASSPPYTWQVGDVVVAGASGLRYISTTGGTLQPGGTLLVSFAAEAPSALYNDSLANLTLVTAFAGVTASSAVGDFTTPLQNGAGTGRITVTRLTPGVAPFAGLYVFRIDSAGDPGVATFSLAFNGGVFIPQGVLLSAGSASLGYGILVSGVVGSGTPNSFLVGDTYTVISPGGTAYVQGSDEESDRSLIVRCQARWPSLSYNPTQDVFRLWAKLAYPAANRVSVRAHPQAAGQVQIEVAAVNGGVDAQSAAAIAAYIAPKLGDVLSSVTVGSAVNFTVPTAGTITVSGPARTSVQQAAQNAWAAYLGTVDIGGVVILADLEQVIMDAGAIDVQGLMLNGVSGNWALDRDQVPVAGTLATQLVWANA